MEETYDAPPYDTDRPFVPAASFYADAVDVIAEEAGS